MEKILEFVQKWPKWAKTTLIFYILVIQTISVIGFSNFGFVMDVFIKNDLEWLVTYQQRINEKYSQNNIACKMNNPDSSITTLDSNNYIEVFLCKDRGDVLVKGEYKELNETSLFWIPFEYFILSASKQKQKQLKAIEEKFGLFNFDNSLMANETKIHNDISYQRIYLKNGLSAKFPGISVSLYKKLTFKKKKLLSTYCFVEMYNPNGTAFQNKKDVSCEPKILKNLMKTLFLN